MATQLQWIRGWPIERARRRHNESGSFVFVHINKTAGSSIVDALAVPLEHFTALEKIAHIGRQQWDERLTFCVVRNPWDRAVSQFLHRRNTARGGLHADSALTFSEWVARVHNERDPVYRNNEKMFIPQHAWTHDEGGTLLVDHVLRFERLSEDFEHVCSLLGRPGTALPHRKRSTREAYHGYYDDETARIIGDAYRLDAEAFGYSF